MNPGSEPERDDTGLPPVDIEIPDDARDLDRDVQAYHRELRADRRRKRRTRWHRSLGRDSIVLPLLACCLILALITGTLLTVFTATSGQNQNNVSSSGASAGRSSRPGRATSGQPGTGSTSATGSPVTKQSGPLPPATLVADTGTVRADKLSHAMLVLVPVSCDCARTLEWLASAARTAGAQAYLIYIPAGAASVAQLYRHLGSQAQKAFHLADDTANLLTGPASLALGIPPGQLTAILVSPGRRVTYAGNLRPTENPDDLVPAMTTG